MGNWQETLNDIARLEADNAALRAEVERLREALGACVKVIQAFKDEATLAEGVHVGLRKGTDAPDAHALWSAIANSRSTAWSDAISFALDPYFTMWGGNDALEAARAALTERKP